MTARRWLWLAGGVVVAAAVYALYRPAPPARPPASEVLVGVPLGAPRLVASPGLWETVRTGWVYYTLPVPNQMVMRPPDGSWIYPFSAAPPFTPPPSSPLRSVYRDETVATYRTEGAGWLYVVDYSAVDSAGSVTAMPAER